METLHRQQLEGAALERAYAMMERQVGHLSRLVDDLLDVSRITRGLVELRKEPVNLGEVADQAMEMVAAVVEGRGHDLQISLPRKPLRVVGDATRLTQVVFNLLNNAAKYTDARVAASGSPSSARVSRPSCGSAIAAAAWSLSWCRKFLTCSPRASARPTAPKAASGSV
jgi:signal transduction histidine kinase